MEMGIWISLLCFVPYPKTKPQTGFDLFPTRIRMVILVPLFWQEGIDFKIGLRLPKENLDFRWRSDVVVAKF